MSRSKVIPSVSTVKIISISPRPSSIRPREQFIVIKRPGFPLPPLSPKSTSKFSSFFVVCSGLLVSLTSVILLILWGLSLSSPLFHIIQNYLNEAMNTSAHISSQEVLSHYSKHLSPDQIISQIATELSPNQIHLTLSPQWKAREWMLFYDNYYFEYEAGGNNKRIIQRYIMAVFFFSLDGPNWKRNVGWPSMANVRKGVHDHYSESAASNPEECTEGNDAFDTPSLSANIDICDWHGIVCDTNNDLSAIWLKDNSLKGALPEELGSLPTLDTLALPTNQISGQFLDSFKEMSHLRQINLFGNQMTGKLPPVWNFPRMEYVGLSNNKFNGKLDERVANLKNLKVLYLHYNQFTGTIPFEIGSMSNLGELALESNLLIGPIPSSVGGMENLKWLSIHDNKLTGTIPTALSTLEKLSTLYLYNNNIRDQISNEFCSMSEHTLKSFYTDCGGEKPNVKCPCCTSCCSHKGCFQAVCKTCHMET